MRRFLSWTVNAIIAWLEFSALLGVFYRFGKNGLPEALIRENLEYLKYMTVLSNLLLGMVATLYALALPLARLRAGRRMPEWIARLKYTAVTLTALTLLTAACYLSPRDGFSSAFSGPNLWFHLILPLLAVADYALLDREGEIPLRASLLPVLAVAGYGAFYLGNLILNGWGGRDHPNDWYGFADRGPAGAFIAVGALMLAGWAVALIIRLGHAEK